MVSRVELDGCFRNADAVGVCSGGYVLARLSGGFSVYLNGVYSGVSETLSHHERIESGASANV